MDLRTVMLMLAVGSFVFGLLLLILKFVGSNRQRVRFWIAAKFLQAAGSLLLYYRVGIFDSMTVLAHTALLLGCAYEAWAVRVLTGRPVDRRVHLLTSAGVIVVCSSIVFWASPYRSGAVFLLQSLFFFLPAIFLFHRRDHKFFLELLLGVCYFAAGTVLFIAAVVCWGFPEFALSESSSRLFGMIPLISFCMFLISGYIMLMLAKERSDREVAEMKRSLEETEVQFQRVVETAVEGILVFDRDFRVTFANQKMASVLGYTTDEMLGRPYVSFVPESHLDVHDHQASLRRRGKDSVYECLLVGKDGEKRWFLISAKAIVDDNGRFEGSFAMLTDITERKDMELALEESNRRLRELSNRDSLTGIANRRCFDETLEREYSRLKRSRSKLSVVLFDLDHFKAYNDRYGHVMGDDVLRRIGGALKESLRESVDLAARYGGEEFACILPDTDIHSAVKVAERIKQRIADLEIEHEDSPVSSYITASFGVTTVQYSPELSLDEIVDMADKLMYKANAAGRNRIESAEWRGYDMAVSE